MKLRPMILALRDAYVLDWRGAHGIAHWARVRAAGLFLARRTGADPRVVELFALLHDACRRNDAHDPEHGPRAARLAEGWNGGEHFELEPARLALLTEAIDGHTEGRIHSDPTIQCCWDADRLDLGRVGIVPDPRRLGTAPAKDPRTIERCYERSRRWARAFRRRRHSK